MLVISSSCPAVSLTSVAVQEYGQCDAVVSLTTDGYCIYFMLKPSVYVHALWAQSEAVNQHKPPHLHTP
ncbi:hypothetical protein FKM82_003886 [Ascaphus truei]